MKHLMEKLTRRLEMYKRRLDSATTIEEINEAIVMIRLYENALLSLEDGQ